MDVRTAIVQHHCSWYGFSAFLKDISAKQTPAITGSAPVDRLSAYGCNILEERYRTGENSNCSWTAVKLCCEQMSLYSLWLEVCVSFSWHPTPDGGSLQIAVLSMKYEETHCLGCKPVCSCKYTNSLTNSARITRCNSSWKWAEGRETKDIYWKYTAQRKWVKNQVTLLTGSRPCLNLIKNLHTEAFNAHAKLYSWSWILSEQICRFHL